MSTPEHTHDGEAGRDTNPVPVKSDTSRENANDDSSAGITRRHSGSPLFGEEARISSYFSSKTRDGSASKAEFSRYPYNGSHQKEQKQSDDPRKTSQDENTKAPSSNSVAERAPESKQTSSTDAANEKSIDETHVRDTQAKNDQEPKAESSTVKHDNQPGSTESTPTKNPSIDTSVLSPIPDSATESSFYKVLEPIEDTHNEPYTDDSEAETIPARSPPRMDRGRRLVRQSKLKDDEEDGDEENEEEEEEEEESNDEDHSNKKYHSEVRKVAKLKLPETTLRPYKLKRDSSGCSLLQRACKKGNVSDVLQLLQRGADANEADFCGFTCLHEAALAGHTEVAKILIEHGADVNKQALEAGDLETPLIDASENQHTDTVKLLLKHGADTRVYNIDGFTALTKIYNDHADEEGYEEIIKLLEDASHRIAGKSSTSSDPLLDIRPPSRESVVEDPNDPYFGELIRKKSNYIVKHAAEGHKELIANYLLEGGNLLAQPDIFIVAARNGHLEMINIILGLAADFDVDTENSCGLTALLASVGRGHRDVVSFLLAKGANPFKKRNDSMNTLEIASKSANFDPVEVRTIQEAMNLKQKAVKAEDTKSSDVNKTAKSIEKKISETKSKSDETSKAIDERPSEPKKRKASKDDIPVLAKRIDRKASVSQEPQEQEQQLHDTISYKRSSSHGPDLQEQNSPRDDDSRDATPKPPQSPVNNISEEQRVRNAEEARIWQEKVEAKKRARRDMFLKLEKEKERKRKEEEERKIEEAKRKETERLEREREKTQKLKQEAQERSKALENEKHELRYKLIVENYPEGLLRVNKNLNVSERMRNYSPLYVFDIDSVAYVVDVQLYLLTGVSVSLMDIEESGKRKATSDEKGAIWNIICNLLGEERGGPGAKKFNNLLVQFLQMELARKWCKESHPDVHDEIWGANRTARVDLGSFKQLSKTSPSVVKPPESQARLEEDVFVPRNLKRRFDALSAIQASTYALW